jgi:hypothetical protein
VAGALTGAGSIREAAPIVKHAQLRGVLISSHRHPFYFLPKLCLYVTTSGLPNYCRRASWAKSGAGRGIP